MDTVKKKTVQFCFRTCWVIALILALSMSLTVFSIPAFADGPEEAAAETSVFEPGGEAPGGGSVPEPVLPEPAVEEQTPGEAVEEQTPGEAAEEQTPGEAAEEQTPDEAAEEQTPGEAVEEQTPGEAVEEQTPGEDAGEQVSVEAAAVPLFAAPGGDPNGAAKTDVQVELKTASETIKAATADVSRHSGGDEDESLVSAIQDAVGKASEGVAHVILSGTDTYQGGPINLYSYSNEGAVSKFVFESKGGETATLHSDINISSGLFVEIINVLFGNDCTLVVYNDSSLTVGSREQRFNGDVSIFAGHPNETDSVGYATVYAGDGGSVTSRVKDGTVTVVNGAGDSVIFSGNTNVAVKSDKPETTTDECTVVISSGKEVTVEYIEAWDANVIVNSPVVTVRDAVMDGQIGNSPANKLRSFKIIAASEDSEVFDLTESVGLSDVLAKLGVSDVLTVAAPVEKAQVNILGSINAREDITVYSFTTQTKNLLDTVVNTALNVKIGSASITLGDGVRLNAGQDITLKATTRSTAGYDEVGKPVNGALPLAFNVFVENAAINLGKGSSLTAGGDITADALSTIKANASCSFGSLFIGVAFNVIVNEASVEAAGAWLTADGDVNLISKADTVAIADAKRSGKNDSLNGLYFATNVIIQDSKTNVGDAARITAGGDVNISSTSDVDATDDAIASVGTISEDVSAFPLKSALKTVGFDVLGRVISSITSSEAIQSKLTSLGDFFTRNKTKVEAAQKFFKTDGYSIEVDAGAQEKGTVKAKAFGEGSDKLSISVDSKYEVEKVLVRYLPYQNDLGANAAVYKFTAAVLNQDTGNYEVDMFQLFRDDGETVTLQQFRVYVFYSDKMKDNVEMDDIPNGGDDDDDFGLSDLFDTALESAADDSDADADCAGKILLVYKYLVNGTEDPSKGFIAPDAMAAGVDKATTSLSVINGVAEGKNVRFNPSPNIINGTTMYKVKAMKATYTDAGGEHTVDIQKNNAGHYVFTVPSGITNSSLTITTEFEPGENTPSSPSSNQITGSLAVGVVVNHNDAIVDLGETGSITAAGQVNVSAEATSNIAGKADGTSVTESSATKGKTTKQTASGTEQTLENIDIKEGDRKTGEKLYVYGRSLENSTTAVVNGTVYTITLAPNGDYGCTLPETIELIVLGEDNREHTIKVSGTNGVYTVDTAKIDFKRDVITEEEQERGFGVRSLRFVAQYGVNTYKVSAEKVTNGSITVDRSLVCGLDTITVTATPKTGYAVDSVKLRYIDKYGLVQEVSFNTPVSIGKDFYTYVLPKDSELAQWGTFSTNNSRMAVVVTFTEESTKQTIVIDSSLDGVSVDKTEATYGEVITIIPAVNRQLILDVSKFKVTYKDSENREIDLHVNDDFTFTIPVKGAITQATTFTVTASEDYKKEAKVDLTADAAENGSVTVNNGRTKTGSGDMFYVTVKSNDGYVLKAGTLTAEYVNGTTTVKLGAPKSMGNGVYRFTVGDAVGNSGGKVTVKAEFTSDEASSSSTGVAVAVNVEVHRNNALIKSGSINAAKGISVNARTNGKAVTQALAGYSTAKTGVAGAIAVGVNSYKTNAIIGKGVSLSENNGEEHKLSVNAQSNISSFKTDADATNMKVVPDPGGKGYIVPGVGIVVPNEGTAPEGGIILPGIGIVTPNPGTVAGKTGVGTGIAVAVNGVDTRASINKGVVYNYTKTADKISVSASNTVSSDEVNAKAGAASGKTAVSPVVALNIVTSDAKAYLGRVEKLVDGGMASVPLNTRAVELKASNSAAHKMTVATYAIGNSTAMAGSFGINIIDDSAEAILDSDIRGTATDVKVDAQSVSALEAYIAAGAAGSREGKKKADDSKGSADQKADSIISSGEKLGAKTGMGASTEGSVKNRQQAQTSEGSVAGAAAFGLNIQSNKSEARIADGVSLGGNTSTSALGDVQVGSRTLTSADLSSDSSATSVKNSGASVGIGVSVAINIASSENKAYLGSGLVNAGNVSVSALSVLDDKGKEKTNTFNTSAVSGASAGSVGVAGSVALAVLNNTTSALVNKAQGDSYTAASTTIRAEDKRSAETTASASATQSGKADKNASKTDDKKTADADSGKAVGVGASFAMVYGDNTVIAKFIAPASSETGAFMCEASSDHSEESTAVAGSDAYKNLFPATYDFTSKSTNIAVDAAAAVNAVETTVTALLTADGYTPVVNAKSVRLSAVEKGHSKTDSSGYALGTDTAVGGSVAVNLNKSTVRSSNDGFLKVSGGDYTGDDEEGHQRSVEITASSEVTEENLSFALAAGGDVLRYVEKYKSLLNTIDHYKGIISAEVMKAEAFVQLIKAFLDGTYFNEMKAKYDEAVNTIKELRGKIYLTPEEQKKLDEATSVASNSGNSLADKLLSLIPIAEGIVNVGSKLNSLSTNLMAMRNIVSPSTSKMNETTGKAVTETNNKADGTGTKVDNTGAVSGEAAESESMQIAAAVAVSVSDHKIFAENRGEIRTEGAVRISADNSVDALAHAFGAAVSTNGGTGSIGLAIAVKVDQNKVRAISEKNITVGSGKDVIIAASLGENTHDFSGSEKGTKTDFTTTIGTQAVAGAVSGDAKTAISGAVVVFVSSSETLAELADNAVIRSVDDARAGDVSITAVETARQTMRTAAVSASQANLSLGISAGVMVTKNTTTARVGKNASIKAKNIAVEAQRKSVSLDTDSGIDVTPTEGEPNFGNKDEGEGGEDEAASGTTAVKIDGLGMDGLLIIDTDKATGGQAGETISVNIDKDQIKALLESALNSLSHVDYYIAVDSGSVAADSGKSASSGIGSIAGAVAVVTINNTVSAIVDEGAVLDADVNGNAASADNGNISVEARSAEQTRMISGAISVDTAASAKAAVGAVIAFLHENNNINALVNDGAVLTAGGRLSVAGQNTGRSEVYTVTGSVAENATPATANVAATVHVILSETAVSVKLGKPGEGNAHKALSAEIIAENSKALRNITVSLAVGNSKVQVGGAVAVIDEESSAVILAEETVLHVVGKFASTGEDGKKIIEDLLVLRADNTHDMFLIMCSASAAVGAGAGASAANVAGIVSVILDASEASVYAPGSELIANFQRDDENGANIVIAARNESDLLNVNVQVTVGTGSGAAVGAAVTVNILERTVENTVSTSDKPSVIIASNGGISLTADASDRVIVIAAGANATSANVSVQGDIVVLVENNTVKLTAQKITLETVNLTPAFQSGDTVISAEFNGELYGVAGGINFTSGSVAAGATVIVAVTDNTTVVDLSSDSLVMSSGKIQVSSAADTRTLFISIGAAGAVGTVAVEGSVVTVVASDKISIHLGNVSLLGKEVTINAVGKSSETYISGALAASGGISVGPSVLVFVKERSITIDSAPGGKIGGDSGCTVTALAQTDDDIFTLVLAMAASGTTSVSAGVCTEIINNAVTCDIDADINAGRYEIIIGAKSDRSIANYIFGGGFAGNTSVVPVATVIYLTDTVLADVSGTLTGHKVGVTADTAFALKEVAAGVAVAGVAGISGTFAVVVNGSDTRAMFSGGHTGNGESPELNVLANDEYKFNSVMANLAAGATAGVGVNAAITIVKNNVLASIGDRDTKKDIRADIINVSARSEREIRNIVGVLSFGGAAGASVNVAVVVAGSKLPQDAFDMLTRKNDAGEESFNSQSVLNAIGNGNPYVKSKDYLKTVTLNTDIQGNGQKDSGIQVDNVEGSGFVSDLAKTDTEDYEAGDNNATEKDKLRGEDSVIDPSTDTAVSVNGEAGKNAGYSYNEKALSAAVQALVYNVNIECLDLSISADDVQKAEIDSITGAAGVEAGVSVGVSVLVLHSNVIAELESSADVVCRTININAASGSDDGKIAVIGGSAGIGGIAGVAVAVGVVHLDDVVKASLAGNVTAKAQRTGISNSVNVIAESDYSDVSASTAAVGGGLVGVSASVAVVSLNGAVMSTISGNVLSARDNDKVTAGFSSVNTIVFFNNSVTARAASLAAGLTGVAAGVAVASETLTVSASIEEDAVVELANINDSTGSKLRVLVAGSFDGVNTQQGRVKGIAQVAGISGGLVAAGFSVAVAYIEPSITSCIAGTVRGVSGILDVTVGNDIYTESETGLAAAEVGQFSFGANVLIAYNSTKARSSVTGSVNANSLTVMSLLSANAVSSMITVSAGQLAMGVSTALSILDASNEASVGTDADIRAVTLNVLAGATAPGNYQSGADFFSDAQLYSGAVGEGTVEVNVAVAVNKAVNKAMLNTSGNVFANTVNVYAYGNPTASSATNKLTGALMAAGGAAAASTLSFDQQVEINCTSLNGLDGGLTTVNAGSYLYPGEAKDPSGEKFKRDYDQASASVDVFAISFLNINANVSYAKNNTISRVSAAFGTPIGSVMLDNNGSANARAKVAEVGGNVLGIGANVLLSYVQAQFITELSTRGVEGNVDAKTDFVSNANAGVQASSGSLAGLQVNVIVAKSTTRGSTVFDGNSDYVKAESISIVTAGDSTTCAQQVKSAYTGSSILTVAATVIESILSTTQEAILKNIRTVGTADINVNSSLNAGPDSSKYSALASFEGAPDAVSVNFGDIKVNVVLAKNYAANRALLSNVYPDDNQVAMGDITVSAENRANAFANAGTYSEDAGKPKDQQGFDIALVSIGVIVTTAHNESENTAQVSELRANADSLTVNANQRESYAISSGGTSSNGAVRVVGIGVNVSDATNDAINRAVITDSQAVVKSIAMKTAAENVYADAHIGSVNLSVDLIDVAANKVTATNHYQGSAIIENSTLTGESLDVQSVENQHYFEESSYKTLTSADVGAAGSSTKRSISLLSTDVNSATAENTSEILAKISGTVLKGYDTKLFAYGRADVESDIESPAKIGLLSVGVIKTQALANGSVKAEYEPAADKSEINSLDVKAIGDARAKAQTGVAGTVNVELFNSSTNSADADIEMLVRAAVSGGELVVDKASSVTALASAIADAETQSPGFAIGLASIGINEARATSHIQVNADVEPGTYSFDSLNVEACIPTEKRFKYELDGTKVYFDGSSTNSLVRPSYSGSSEDAETVKVTLIGGDNHTSDADSQHRVSVNIGKDGKGTITANSIKLDAVGNATTFAGSEDVDATYGLVTAGGSLSRAVENDITEININTESITTKNSVNVNSTNESANVKAEGSTPGGFSVIGVMNTLISADIDNVARINVNGSVQGKDIVFSAANDGKAATGLAANKGSVSLISVDNASVPVTENFLTEIVFGKNSQVRADEALTISTDTYCDADSYVSQKTGGVIFDAATLKGDAEVESINHIKVGEGAEVKAASSDLAVNMLNRGKLSSISDYNSSFSLIGKNDINAELQYTAKNIFEMEKDSSLSADKGNVTINQNSSNVEMSCYSESVTREGLGAPTALGENTVVSDNILSFSDIHAGKSINVNQYGGAKDAKAFGRVKESSFASACTCSGINDFTINNRVSALNGADMNAKNILVKQGADSLNLSAASRAWAESIGVTLSGRAENNVRINNEMSGGMEEIGKGAGRIFVSDIDAPGRIECESEAASAFIEIGKISKNNSLVVNSDIGKITYSGFLLHQNKFNSSRITGDSSPYISYNPDGLPSYYPSVVTAVASLRSFSRTRSSRIVREFMEKLEASLQQVDYYNAAREKAGDAMKVYLDEDGYLVIENSGLFAADMDQMDFDWVYAFLTAQDVCYMANIDYELVLDSDTDFMDIIEGAEAAEDVTVDDSSIRFYVIDNGKRYDCEIEFDRKTGTISAYYLDGNTKIRVSVIAIELDGVMYVVVYNEEDETQEAFVQIPEFDTGDRSVIRVKVSDELLEYLGLI